MKLHLPTGLRAAILACFAAVSSLAVPPVTASLAGAAVVATFIAASAPAWAESVTWDANWNATDAPSEIPDTNVLSELPSGSTFLSAEGSSYTADGQTVVRLNGTAPDAAEVNVFGGAGMTTTDTSVSEGPLTANTWMKVTGGTYSTLVGGSYAQNYSGGEPANFTGDTHILLQSEGGNSPTVDYIIGGNYMDAQNAVFTGNTYVSVEGGTVNGSIVGAGTSGHNQATTINGHSHIWVYTPLSGSAAARFELPGNFIIGGNAAVSNYAPILRQNGDSSVTIDLSTYNPAGGVGMEKSIVGGAWLLTNTSSTHTGNSAVSIKGAAADSTQVNFSGPVVGGAWFAGSGTATLSGNTQLTISGGAFAGPLVGGAYVAADSTAPASYTMANATISLSGGSVAGNIIGGSYISSGSGLATQQTGDITLSISGGEVSGTLYGGSLNLRNNAESIASHGAISISLSGGSISGNVYAGGGVGEGMASGVKASSTQVTISDTVTLGTTDAGITISGGVENSNAASGVAGDRTLVLNGENAYTNLDNATFHDFNIVNNASAATIKLQEVDSDFTKKGSGSLTINGAESNLDTISSLTVAEGALNTGTAWLTQGGQGLTAITIGAGASLATDGLRLRGDATLSLDVTNASSSTALIAVGSGGGLIVGDSPNLSLTLEGVMSLAGGSQVTLMSWGNTEAQAPISLSTLTWVNKAATGMEAFELSIANKSLILSRAEAQDLSGSGTLDTTADGKAVSLTQPAAGDAIVSVSGDVTPQSVVVTNDGSAAYTIIDAPVDGGSIGGTTGLTKNGNGTLNMELANTYSGGTTINGGTVNAAVEGSAGSALGTGAVTLNNGGELLASAADAVAGNAIVFNGGSLSYSADETRDLDSAAISHEAGQVPTVSVASGNEVSWNYDNAASLQAAVADGLKLSGGGSLKLDATADVTTALAGPISLEGENTSLELGSMGSTQLGTAAAPVAISLAEGTSLRVERPESATASSINAALSGEGTLEFTNTNATADNSVSLSGSNEAFNGSINLGTEGGTPLAGTDAPAVLLDYSLGSPVGGEGSELNLNGLAFATVQNNGTTTTTAADINVNSSTTQYAQTAGLTNTFSGDVIGEAGSTWTLDTTPVNGGQTNILAGDITDYEGTLEAIGKEGSISRWVLGSGMPVVSTFAVNPETTLAVNLSAANEYNEFVFDYAQDISLAGAVTGTANLTQQGAGTLVLTGDNTSSGTLRIAEGSTVQLGSADDAALWGVAAGSELAGNGTLTLVNGTLGGTLTPAAGSSPVVNVEVAAGGTVDMNGNGPALITGSFTMNAGSSLTNVGTGSIDKELTMALGQGNIGKGTAATAMVQFVDGGKGSTLGSTTEAINLDASAAGVIELLREHRVAGAESYLTLTNGTLLTAADYSNVSFGANMDILDELGLRLERVDGGSLVLSGTAQGVYIAGEGEDPTEVTGYQHFGAYQSVAVMGGETLTLNLDGAPDAAIDGAGATINNLLGAEDSNLEVNNTDTTGEVAVVILNNSVQSIDPVPEGLPGDPVGANTTFGGDISESLTGGDVEFVKTGAGTLTLGGSLDAHQLTAQEGVIALNDEFGNDLDALSLAGGMVQLGDGVTDVDTLSDTEAGGRLSIAEGATLALAETSVLEEAQLEGPGTLEINGELTLAEEARLNAVALDVDGGTLVLNGTTGHTTSALDGDGTLSGTGTVDTVGLGITGTGGEFSGSFAGNGTLTVAAGAEQSFSDGFAGGAGWNLTNNGRMTLDFVSDEAAATTRANAPVALNALTLGAGAVTNLNIDLSAPVANLLTLSSIEVAPSAAVNLNAVGTQNILRRDTSYVIGSVSGGQAAGELTTITPDAADIVFMLVDANRSNLSIDADGNLRLNLVTSRRNNLMPLASNANSAAGAALLWDAAFRGNTAVGTDIRRLLAAFNSGATDADRTLAALAGAGTTVLSSALAADLERQLRAIRNRSSLIEGKACVASGKGALSNAGPRYGVWMNGEGDHRKMKAEGYMPGYTLTTWGGTLGMDVSCSENLVGGLALTALYGDLKARSADNASGDFNRYYISAFAKMKQQRWQHTLLGTVGRLDADLDRTVYYGTGSYRTHGNPMGWGYGLMYEIGYDLPMDEDARFTLQPVVNATWRYADVDGYTESGSDAALRVGDQDYNVVTLGAGFRTRGEVGMGWFNRRALLEARALVKVDMGDRRAASEVALLGGGGYGAKVHSAKLSAVGVELGAGLSIPLGANAGALFIDGSAELRNEYSNLNGSIGYRFEF